MYSFYGGRPGNSFVITKTYASYEDMVADFNSDNCNVHYDEHVLINSANKNNKYHGNIYRRGYNGEPEEIGNIAGPSGPPPNLQLIQQEDIPQKVKDTYTERSGTIDMINGANNSQIQWHMYEDTTQDNANKTVYVNFQVPYPVFNFEIESVSPYDATGAYINRDPAKVTAIQTGNPFNQQWKLSIPTGLNGEGFSDFNIIEEKDADNQPTGYYTFTYKITAANHTPQLVTKRIGPIKGIKTIETDSQTNRVYIRLSDGNSESFSIIPENGIISDVDFNHGILTISQKGVANNITTPIPIITDVKINNENRIQLTSLSGGTSSKITSNIIQDPTKIKQLQFNMNQNNKEELQVLYNDNGDWQSIGEINKISDIKIQNQRIYIQRHNRNTWEDLGTPYEYLDSTLDNIDWVGTGLLTKTTEDQTLEFYLPLNTIIPIDTEATISGGQIDLEYEYIDENETVQKSNLTISNFYGSTVEKTLTGLHISLKEFSSNQDAPFKQDISFVNLKITNLALTLTKTAYSNKDTDMNIADTQNYNFTYDESSLIVDPDLELEEQSDIEDESYIE